MIIKRISKTFSSSKSKREKENKERTKKDKSWDSVYGAGVGGAAGVGGSAFIYKKTKRLREQTQDIFDKINANAEEKADKINKQAAKDLVEGDIPGNFIKENSIDAGKHKLNRDAANKSIRRVKLNKKLAYAGMIALPIAGSVLGGLYGRDNDLRKQRRKIEDMAGNKVAESIKKIR